MTITPESKSDLTVTNEAKKPTDTKWNEATWTWNDDEGTWALPGVIIKEETKNSLTITPESKT